MSDENNGFAIEQVSALCPNCASPVEPRDGSKTVRAMLVQKPVDLCRPVDAKCYACEWTGSAYFWRRQSA